MKSGRCAVICSNCVHWQIAYPERYTYLEDSKVENVDIFTKGTATVAANMRENLNMRFVI